jgi:hypothetical protein
MYYATCLEIDEWRIIVDSQSNSKNSGSSGGATGSSSGSCYKTVNQKTVVMHLMMSNLHMLQDKDVRGLVRP